MYRYIPCFEYEIKIIIIMFPFCEIDFICKVFYYVVIVSCIHNCYHMNDKKIICYNIFIKYGSKSYHSHVRFQALKLCYSYYHIFTKNSAFLAIL